MVRESNIPEVGLIQFPDNRPIGGRQRLISILQLREGSVLEAIDNGTQHG